jgi:hypothetical protein
VAQLLHRGGSSPDDRRTRLDQLRPPFPACFSRADGRTRTGDPFITSEVLYQLSYVGERPANPHRALIGRESSRAIHTAVILRAVRESAPRKPWRGTTRDAESGSIAAKCRGRRCAGVAPSSRLRGCHRPGPARDATSSLLIAAQIGRRALDELLATHRLSVAWLDEGRVRKLALVAEPAYPDGHPLGARHAPPPSRLASSRLT